MRYLVLLRHGFGEYTVALQLSRSTQGHISCIETLPGDPRVPGPGMTWWIDGRYRLTSRTGARERSHRMPLTGLTTPQLAYKISGSTLLDPKLPKYTDEMRGATVQLAAEAVRAYAHRAELQLLLTPRGHVPEHRETVGDRVIEVGDPSIWIVLTGFDWGDPAGALAAYGVRPRPSLRVSAKP